MGLIPEEVIGEIRQRIDIVAVVGEHVQLRKAGRNHKGLCPFHHERTPSFNVNGDKGFFYCFGCHKKGDVFTFLMEYDGKSFIEAAESLAARAGVEIPRISTPEAHRARSERTEMLRVCDLAADFYREALIGAQGARARDYLAGRGIGEEVSESFRLGYAPDSWRALVDYLASREVPMALAEKAGLIARQPRAGGFYDRFRDRVLCPVTTTSGDVVGFSGRLLGEGEGAKYINSPESPLYKKSRLLFGVKQAREGFRRAGRAVVVEGNFDVIALHQAGFTETVAPLGTALTPEQAETLRRLCDRVVLLYDGDRAGRAASLKTLETLVAADVETWIAELPPGEDPDSLCRGRGAEAMAALLDRAQPGVEHFIHQVWAGAGRSADGRADALREAAEVLRSIADPIKRDFLVGTFAAALGVDEPTLRRGLRRALKGQQVEIKKNPPAPRTAPPPEEELHVLALLADHPDLVKAAEAQDVFSLLTDSRLRDMYCAAREGHSVMSAAPEDPTIARFVLSGHYADLQAPEQTLADVVGRIQKVRARANLAQGRRGGDREEQMRRLQEIVTTRKQVD